MFAGRVFGFLLETCGVGPATARVGGPGVDTGDAFVLGRLVGDTARVGEAAAVGTGRRCLPPFADRHVGGDTFGVRVG